MRRAAFTLVETLAVLALFALMTGFVVMNHDALLPSLRAESPETVLRGGFRTAMRTACENRRRTVLRFDSAKAVLTVYSDTGDIIAGAPCGKPGQTGVRFLDPTVEHPDDIDPGYGRVEFSPEGHHRPVRVELKIAGKTRRFLTEPFSGLLTEEKSS